MTESSQVEVREREKERALSTRRMSDDSARQRGKGDRQKWSQFGTDLSFV